MERTIESLEARCKELGEENGCRIRIDINPRGVEFFLIEEPDQTPALLEQKWN